jgi:hypothetical protein
VSQGQKGAGKTHCPAEQTITDAKKATVPTMDQNEFITRHEVLGMLWVFGWLAFFLVLIVLGHFKRRHQRELNHKERLAALEKGVPMPEIYDGDEKIGAALESHWHRKPLNPRWPLGVGALSVMAGLGTSLALWLSGDPGHNELWPFGLIAVFLGFGLFLHYALTRPQNADEA